MGSGWNTTVNVTPDIADCLSNINTGGYVNSSFIPGCSGSDITVTVVKNGVTTLNRAVVYSNINPNTAYSVNLLDSAYGLQSFMTYPSKMTFLTNGTLTSPTITAQYAYQFQSNYTYSVPLGSLEYSTNNNYWIPQSYYYQMGGVFLSQIDGITYKLPPEITFANNGNGNITVNIVAIAYDPSDSGGTWWQQPGAGINLPETRCRQSPLCTGKSQYLECKHQYHHIGPECCHHVGSLPERGGKPDGGDPDHILYCRQYHDRELYLFIRGKRW